MDTLIWSCFICIDTSGKISFFRFNKYEPCKSKSFYWVRELVLILSYIALDSIDSTSNFQPHARIYANMISHNRNIFILWKTSLKHKHWNDFEKLHEGMKELIWTLNCRITGIYAIVLGFFATLYKFLDFGPNNTVQTLTVNSCKENWWRNLLYVANLEYAEGDSVCMPIQYLLA